VARKFTEHVHAHKARRAGAGVMLAVVLTGIGLRLAYVDRPLDDRMRAPWRQSDYAQIARNFWREDPNILQPRIDWRRDGPGLVEAEFPLLPWTAGMLDRLLGYHEATLRALSAVLSIGSLLLFSTFASRLLSPPAALAAVAFYAFNPLLLDLSTAMQPEPLMLFLGLLAVVLLSRWERTGVTASLLLAAAALAGAIMAKATTAYLGLVFAFVILRRWGLPALRNARVWLAGVIAIGPPAAWYLWAKHYWVLYGNSLGLSNQYPFLGLDMLRSPDWILGLLKWQTLGVLMPLGWLLLLAARRAPRPSTTLPAVWLASVWLLLIVAARSTSADWAFYYHAAAVAPACLLMGAGIGALLSPDAAGVLGLGPGRLRRRVAAGLAAGMVVLLAGAILVVIRSRDNRPDLHAMRACGLSFLSEIPSAGRIVVRGGHLHDPSGHLVAHDRSMFFAWLDRKGFTYVQDDLSVKMLLGIAARGGRYWIAEAGELTGPLQKEVAEHFRLLAHCAAGYYLYDLQSPPTASPPGQETLTR
jgi:hypothetical protein